ncbi:MAG TPA: hypothetical protein VFG68_23335 [Fimbriiglobus sp.]|nr:hypothetical protein [Fimbriiglobus sp.]
MSTTPTPVHRSFWQRWRDFWFAPSDPTTLGFIRIVTGCLVLYVHLAYSFDLQSFFGPHGWYGLEYVNRERRELPHVVPPLTWDFGQASAHLPEFPHRKKAVLDYIHHLLATNPTRADMERSLAYLDRLQRSGNIEIAQVGVYYINQLAIDDRDRKNQLAVLADESKREAMRKTTVPDLRIPDTPPFLNALPKDERARVADEAEAFFKTLPQGSSEDAHAARGYIYSHFNELSFAQRTAFLDFLKELPTLDPAERDRRMDYLTYWNQEARYTYRLGNPIFSIWFHVTDPAGMAVAHGIALVIFFLFTVGFCTRMTSVLTWLAAVSYIHRTQQVLFGMDTMMNILLIYLMIGNSGAALSVDRVINRYRAVRASLRRSGGIDPATQAYLERPPLSVTAGFACRLLQVHFCFIYMASGLSKLKGPAWWNTNAYWDTLVNPEFTLIHYQWYESMIRGLASERWLYGAVAAGGVAFTFVCEIGLPFLVWTRLRPYVVMMGLVLHAGIAVFMGLWIFSLLMMTMLLVYLPGAAIRERIFGVGGAGRRLSLRFNPQADRQARAAALAKALDFDGRVDAVPAGNQPSVRVVADGREAAGSAAAAALLGNLGWLRPARWVLAVPGLGGAVSRWVSGEVKVGDAATVKPQVPAAS